MNAEHMEKRRWLYLIVAAIGLLFVGVIYAWSILKAPLTEAFGWNASTLAMNYTIMMCCFCLGSMAAGLLSRKTDFRILLVASGIAIMTGYLLLATVVKAAVWNLYAFYGVLIGGGIGIAYNTLLTIGNAWFPDKKGTSSGLLMMCFGFSTMLLGKLSARLFDLPAFGWRKTYILLGISILTVLILAAILLKKPDEHTVLPKAVKKKRTGNEEGAEYTAREMICRPTFWLYYLYGFLGASVGSAVISFAKELSLSLGASASAATLLVGLLSVANGLGRILCGFSFDAFGRRKTMILSAIVTMAAPALMIGALFAESLMLAIVSLCLTGISYGTNPTISSAFISSFYGMRNFALNYSISNSKLLFSSFAATLATALLSSTGSYIAPFVMLLGMAAVSFGLVFLIREP